MEDLNRIAVLGYNTIQMWLTPDLVFSLMVVVSVGCLLWASHVQFSRSRTTMITRAQMAVARAKRSFNKAQHAMKKAHAEMSRLQRETVSRRVADELGDKLLDLYASDQLTKEQYDFYNRHLGHALGLSDLIPKESQRALKQRIKRKRIAAHKMVAVQPVIPGPKPGEKCEPIVEPKEDTKPNVTELFNRRRKAVA